MNVEFIRIFGEDLDIGAKINELIFAAKHKEQWTPEAEKLKKFISSKIILFLPEYAKCDWSFGRETRESTYIKIFNPDW